MYDLIDFSDKNKTLRCVQILRLLNIQSFITSISFTVLQVNLILSKQYFPHSIQ